MDQYDPDYLTFLSKKIESWTVKNLGGLQALGKSKLRYCMTMGQHMNHWICLDGRLVQKISKCQSFKEPHQNFFEKMSQQIWSLRGLRSFGTLGGATDTLIK